MGPPYYYNKKRKLPQRLKNIIVSLIHDSHWEKAFGYLFEYTPWTFFMIDVINEHGFVSGVFDVGQTFGMLFNCKVQVPLETFLATSFPNT